MHQEASRLVIIGQRLSTYGQHVDRSSYHRWRSRKYHSFGGLSIGVSQNYIFALCTNDKNVTTASRRDTKKQGKKRIPKCPTPGPLTCTTKTRLLCTPPRTPPPYFRSWMPNLERRSLISGVSHSPFHVIHSNLRASSLLFSPFLPFMHFADSILVCSLFRIWHQFRMRLPFILRN